MPATIITVYADTSSDRVPAEIVRAKFEMAYRLALAAGGDSAGMDVDIVQPDGTIDDVHFVSEVAVELTVYGRTSPWSDTWTL